MKQECMMQTKEKGRLQKKNVFSYNPPFKKNKKALHKPSSVYAIIYLALPLPAASSSLPACIGRTTHTLLGLAPDEVYHAKRIAALPVGSYPTISPLPAKQAVCFLLHCL